MIKNSKAVKIISYLMENPSAKVAEVAAKNNVSKSYAHKIMKSFDAPFRKPEAKETQVGGSHYKDMPIQPWDALEAWMTLDEIRGIIKVWQSHTSPVNTEKAGMKISQRQSTT
jgi:hypothetical protein